MKTELLALMEAASFCAGVRHKRYSVQQEQLLKNLVLKHQFFKQPLNRFLQIFT